MSQEQPSKSRAVGTIIAVLFVILTLASAGTWYLFFRGGDDAEERAAYDLIMQYKSEYRLDSLGVALNRYLDTYNPDAFHYSQLKDLHDRFFAERADWQAAAQLHSLKAVRGFLEAHPEGLFFQQANRQLDSLSFVIAEDDSTREAYEHYLDQFPEGAYIAVARERLEAFGDAEDSVDDADAYKAPFTLREDNHPHPSSSDVPAAVPDVEVNDSVEVVEG